MENTSNQPTVSGGGVQSEYKTILPTTKTQPASKKVGNTDQSTRKALSSVDKNAVRAAPEPLPKTSAKRSHDESEDKTENPAKKPRAKKDPKAPSTGTEPKPKAASKGKKGYSYDVDDIHLDGEETGKVPIFDTCDDVRRKINAHLRSDPAVSQAGFMREASKALPAGSKLAPNQLGRFLTKKGPTHGATTDVFYLSYVLLEKMRIKAGKPKSKKRLEMEEQWASKGGLDRELDMKTAHFWCGPGEMPYEDQYGKVHFR